MAKKRENLDLYGGQAELFRELKDELADELGYQPSNPRTLGHLIEHYDGPLLNDRLG